MGRTIFLARHGETSWNREGRWQGHTDIALNEVGRAQARKLVEALRGAGVVRVHSSDLARARETAEILATGLGAGAVLVDPGLRERGFGCFEGLTREECEQRFPDEWARYRSEGRVSSPPGGEPQDAVVARMRAALDRAAAALAADPDGHAAVLVSHGGAMRALVSSLTGEMPPPLDNGAIFRIALSEDGYGPITRVAG
jgi:broad specificity phosphatase PhoE